MHNPEFSINLEGVSRIEGHTDLEVKVKDGKVVYAKLMISHSKRFFEQALRGKMYVQAHQIMARICGTCSIAHLSCALDAVEKALGVELSHNTLLLRELMYLGQIIRDHAMHLYLFSLPDVLGVESIMDIAKHDREMVRKILKIKSIGTRLSTISGGRAVHPPYPVVGGFSRVPEKKDIESVVKEIDDLRNDVIEFTDIFFNSTLEFHRNCGYIALKNDDFSFLRGEIKTISGDTIPPDRLFAHLNESFIPYSQAEGYEFEEMGYMVGALARMNINRDNLHPDTIKDAKKYLNVFPSNNVFHNNLAQSIEIIHSFDRAKEIIETIDLEDIKKPSIEVRQGRGIGVVEAPRGTLYYDVWIDRSGKVNYVDVVIPTDQNQIQMERDIRALVQKLLDEGMDKRRISLEVEKLIRAYDPCMSCATHFLRIKWK